MEYRVLVRLNIVTKGTPIELITALEDWATDKDEILGFEAVDSYSWPLGESELYLEYQDMPIEDLGLRTRTLNAITHAVLPAPGGTWRRSEEFDIRTVGDLVSWHPTKLMKFKNFGHASLRDVRDRLAERGLSLLGENTQPS